MTGWTITCDSGGNCPAYINPDTGLAEFSANTGTRDIIYTITYTDENGNCGSTTIRQPGNCSGPGPEPPQPVGACKFTKYTTSNIPSAGGTVTAITYDTELCDASSISATSTTEGVNLSVGDGIITMEVGPTDSQRTIDVTVKVTIDGEEKTYDFTFIQSGSSPTGGWDPDDDPIEVIRTAKNNLQDGSLDDWRPLFKQGVNRTGQPVENALFCRCNKQCYYDDGTDQDYYSKRDTITIKITNSLSGLYIPFNASKFRVNGKYTCFRGVTDCSNGSMNIRYGSKTNKGFDTNFIVPPGKTITMNNCYVFSDAASGGRSAFGFGILKSDDYDLHTDDANTEFNDYFGLVYNYDSANKIATFNITGGTRWGSTTYHYALTNEDVSNGYVKFTNGSKGYIVPIWIGKVADGTWSYTSDSAYAQTLPEGMSLN